LQTTKQIITNGNAPKFEITKLPLAGMVAETAVTTGATDCEL
jgi:hypothetical protein